MSNYVPDDSFAIYNKRFGIKPEYYDYTVFYAVISIAIVVAVLLIVVNLICCCCGEHKDYWADPDTGNRAHVFWPPLTVLVMCIGVVMFMIIKYGDKLCKARSVPFAQSFEIEEQSSDNTTYICEDEKASYRDMMVEDPEMINLQETGKTAFSKECAV